MAGVVRDAVEDVRHLATAHHGFELGGGQLDGDLEVAGVAAVDDHGRRSVVVHAGEKARHHVEGPLRGRESDPLEMSPALADEGVEALEAQGQMAPPLVAGERVHFVHDHRPDTAEKRSRSGRGQEEVQRLGGGDEQVGRLLLHGGPFGCGCVPRADGDPQARIRAAESRGFLPDFGQGHVEVLVHVDGECPQRGDIEDFGRAPGGRSGLGGAIRSIDGHQEPREGLAGAGRRCHEDVAPCRDVRPGRLLRRGRPVGEAPGEPAGDGRMEERLGRGVGHPPISPGSSDADDCAGRRNRSWG